VEEEEEEEEGEEEKEAPSISSGCESSSAAECVPAKTTTRSPGRVPPARKEEQTGALNKGALQLLINCYG